MDIKKVYSVMVMGMIGVSFSAIFIRLSDAPSSIIAMYRMFMTVVLFTPLVLKNKGKGKTKIPLNENLLALLSGLFLALHFLAWIESLKHTTIASSTVLVSLQPLFTTVLGLIMYKEAINKKQFTGMMVAISGSMMIGFGDFIGGEGHFYGDFLALLGGVFAAMYVVIGRGLRKKMNNLDYVFRVYASCTVVLLSVNIMGGVSLFSYPGQEWVLFLALAVFSTIGGHTVFNWSLKYVEANRVSMAMLGEPIGATILGYLILKEAPSSLQLVSGAVILAGLYLFMRSSFEKVESRSVQKLK